MYKSICNIYDSYDKYLAYLNKGTFFSVRLKGLLRDNKVLPTT